ncbi:MAG: anthranilate synthase component I family protein [Deltaproteobacteria bacterium]|nr:anthranilate synthase component I family protein [Deltaproteobacteria bacterium]
MTVDDDWRARAAPELATRLFSRPDGATALPLWADGGRDGTAPYAPGRHVLAAFPDVVERVRVDALAPRELTAWLRARLPTLDPSAAEAPLHALVLAYDAGRNLEALPATAAEPDPVPDVVYLRYPAFAEADGEAGPFRTVARDAAAAARLEGALAADVAAPSTPRGEPAHGALASSLDEAAHARALATVLAGVAAGDLYQANVARILSAPFPGEATPALFAAMRAANPAAFGALARLDDGLWLASSSPECLLRVDAATREVHSYPIKGTRPRAAAPDDDARAAAALRADAKDRAEHVMIVDLVRNDLGRVAVPGSVVVDALFAAMTLPTVHHLVSDVRGTLRGDADLADLLTAVFPGGSITGAPKIAAMALIEAVEGQRRGYYTGSLGLVRGTGDATFNILIRTAVVAGDRVLYGTGGGIVADSDPALEWAETEAKALAFERALGAVVQRSIEPRRNER